MTSPGAGRTSTQRPDSPSRADDPDLQARCAYYLAYVVSHHGEFAEALELTDRSRAHSTTGWTDRGTRPPTHCSPPGPRSLPVTSRAASRPSPRSSDWLRVVEDPWLTVRGEAVLGELARIQRRFDDAVVHLRQCDRDLPAARLPADRGLPALQPGSCPVPGRRLRVRRRPPCVTVDRQGRGDRATCGWRLWRECTWVGSCGPRVTSHGRERRWSRGRAWHRAVRRRRTGAARRVPAGRAGRGGRRPGRGGPAGRCSWPRRAPHGRGPRRGLRAGRARPAGGRQPATRPRPATSATGRTCGWRSPHTSSPSTTGPTRTGSGRPSDRSCLALVEHQEAEASPVMTTAMPTTCGSLSVLAEQEERPHHREGRLHDLGDPDRADLDGALGVDQQPCAQTPVSRVRISM